MFNTDNEKIVYTDPYGKKHDITAEIKKAGYRKVIYCKDCIYNKFCDQCVEENNRLYHVDFCSYAERGRE